MNQTPNSREQYSAHIFALPGRHASACACATLEVFSFVALDHAWASNPTADFSRQVKDINKQFCLYCAP